MSGGRNSTILRVRVFRVEGEIVGVKFGVFVGFDERELLSWWGCKASMRRYAPDVVPIPLKHRELRSRGLFKRPWRVDEEGQFYDSRDGKPFSTQFSHTRFLTPLLAKERGLPWALFCDCDFLWRADLRDLVAAHADPKYAVMVVKHQHIPAEETKMDGVDQTRYYRKNWSSLMLFNVNHPAHKRLTAEAVNLHSGGFMHALDWLGSEDLIGGLPAAWNWLEGVSGTDEEAVELARGLHYTRGTPDMLGNLPCADEWWDAVRAGAQDELGQPSQEWFHKGESKWQKVAGSRVAKLSRRALVGPA